MGSKPIEGHGVPAKLRPPFLMWGVTFEVESSVEPGEYFKEVPFIVGSDEPMADHKVDDHWMGRFRQEKRMEFG